jgi:hypothetical protein
MNLLNPNKANSEYLKVINGKKVRRSCMREGSHKLDPSYPFFRKSMEFFLDSGFH